MTSADYFETFPRCPESITAAESAVQPEESVPLAVESRVLKAGRISEGLECRRNNNNYLTNQTSVFWFYSECFQARPNKEECMSDL